MTKEMTPRNIFWNSAVCRELTVKDVDISNLASLAFGLEVDMSPRYGDWQLIQGIEFNKKIVGAGTYLLISTKSGFIVYEDLKVVSPDFQGLGIGKKITAEVVKKFQGIKYPLHLLARTQNKSEYFSLLEMNRPVFPLDAVPDSDDQEILRDYFLAHPIKRGVVDMDTFIHRGAYKTYPDMTAGLKREAGDDVIDRYLGKHGSSKARGDALYLLISGL